MCPVSDAAYFEQAYYHNVRGKLEAFFAASLMRATGMVGRRIGEVQHAMGATSTCVSSRVYVKAD